MPPVRESLAALVEADDVEPLAWIIGNDTLLIKLVQEANVVRLLAYAELMNAISDDVTRGNIALGIMSCDKTHRDKGLAAVLVAGRLLGEKLSFYDVWTDQAEKSPRAIFGRGSRVFDVAVGGEKHPRVAYPTIQSETSSSKYLFLQHMPFASRS